MTLSFRGLTIFKAYLFYGAGWCWPYVRFEKYRMVINFHCKRGLLISIGWDERKRRWNKTVADMTPEQKKQMHDMLQEIINSWDKPKE